MKVYEIAEQATMTFLHSVERLSSILARCDDDDIEHVLTITSSEASDASLDAIDVIVELLMNIESYRAILLESEASNE